MSNTEIFLIAMAIIFTVPYLIWRVGRTDYYAPLVVVQIITGILLGPGILGVDAPFDLGQHGSTGLPRATAYREANSDWWAWYLPGEAHLGHRRADSAEAAQLAAEDALRAEIEQAA